MEMEPGLPKEVGLDETGMVLADPDATQRRRGDHTERFAIMVQPLGKPVGMWGCDMYLSTLHSILAGEKTAR